MVTVKLLIENPLMKVSSKPRQHSWFWSPDLGVPRSRLISCWTSRESTWGCPSVRPAPVRRLLPSLPRATARPAQVQLRRGSLRPCSSTALTQQVRLQHTYVAGESLSLITKTVRECQDVRAGVLHEKTMWDSASRSRVENPKFQAKFAGFCNKDEDGDFVTDAVKFVSFVHTNVLMPLADHFESVTYFLKREAGKVPTTQQVHLLPGLQEGARRI